MTLIVELPQAQVLIGEGAENMLQTRFSQTSVNFIPLTFTIFPVNINLGCKHQILELLHSKIFPQSVVKLEILEVALAKLLAVIEGSPSVTLPAS